ncbi:hypothetical protein Dsin_018476 [Dipteronia sinensis]|uniref:RRM domain-containing protein n=1 Tax=Dipteronia sinensis TaxID=43782 RepID=A0AAE0E1U2_9ROSI|nr:hypothetical protein Dsin_018476 [Dipteronia sinensis]
MEAQVRSFSDTRCDAWKISRCPYKDLATSDTVIAIAGALIYDKVTRISRGFGFVTMSSAEEVEVVAHQFNGYIEMVEVVLEKKRWVGKTK